MFSREITIMLIELKYIAYGCFIREYSYMAGMVYWNRKKIFWALRFILINPELICGWLQLTARIV